APIDSAVVTSKGQFKIKTHIAEPGFYRLRLGANNVVMLQLSPDEKAVVNGNAMDLYRSYEVTGSPGSEKMQELDRYLRKNYEESDSLRQLFARLRTAENNDSLTQALEP